MRIAILVGLLLCGCAAPRMADHDLPGAPQEWRADSVALFKALARDPDSTTFKMIREPAPGYITGWWYKVKHTGWVWDALFNSRNGFGGMTGWKRYTFFYDGCRIWMYAWPNGVQRFEN